MHTSSAIPLRALLAIAGTTLGLVLLISFRAPDVPLTTAGGPAGTQPPGIARPAAASGAGGAGAAPPTPASTPTTAARATTGDRATTPPATTTPAKPSTTQAPAAPSAAAGDMAGPIERTPYGDVQVKVKVADGKITDVIALQLPSDRRRSAEISQYVEPILHDEALQAQSAQIDTISGATWTSGGYQASLEGALQQLGIG